MYQALQQTMSAYATRPALGECEYFYQLAKIIDLTKVQKTRVYEDSYILLGFCCDEGVKRNFGTVGAAKAPDVFRRTFYNLPHHLMESIRWFDAGDIYCKNSDLEKAQQLLAQKVSKIIAMGAKPIVIGGGHETAWGHLQGLYHQKLNPAIINFDAHFDLRPTLEGSKGSSGTPFYQAQQCLQEQKKPFNYFCAGIQPFANTHSLFDFAKTHQVSYQLAEQINKAPDDLAQINAFMDKHEGLYITVCLDVFNAAIAPGVSAPQAFGINSIFVVECLRALKKCNKVMALDIVELNPDIDVNNQTAKLAALLLAEFLHA